LLSGTGSVVLDCTLAVNWTCPRDRLAHEAREGYGPGFPSWTPPVTSRRLGNDLQAHRAVDDERRQAGGLLAWVGEGEVGQVFEQRGQGYVRL